MTSKKLQSSIMCLLMLASLLSFNLGTISFAAEPEPDMVGTVLTDGDQDFDCNSVVHADSGQWRWLSYPASRIQINPGVRPALGNSLALKVGLFVNGVRNLTSNTNASLMNVQMGPIGGTAANSSSRTTAWYPYKLTAHAVYPNSNVDMTEFFVDKDVFVRMLDVSGSNGQEMTLSTGSSAISGLTLSQQPDGSILGTNTNYYIAFRIVLLNTDGTVQSTVTPTTVSGASYSVKIPVSNGTASVALLLTTAPRSTATGAILDRISAVAQGNLINALASTKAYWDGKLGKVPAPTVWGIQADMAPKDVTPAQHRRSFYAAWTFAYQNIIEPTPETGYDYYQVGLGKASMWTGGHSSTPNSCAWESMFEIEELSMVEPEIAWSAAEGFIKLINDDGTLPGECLPSQKAHMVWTCYDNLPNNAKLAELYPKLKAYLLWRGDNPRWIWGSHNYSDEKDISFVTQWYSDVNYIIKMCEVLGYNEDITMWEQRKVKMTEDSRIWFFTPATGDPDGKIYNSCFPDHTGSQYHYYGDRTADVDNYILSALFINDYPADMVKKLVDHYANQHDIGKDLVGLDFFKYGDGCHIVYGLIQKSGLYPYLEDMYKEFINANIRTVVKVGEFCEESRPDNYATQGTCPTSFGASTMIDFTYINNGARIDSGHLTEINVELSPEASSLYFSSTKFKMDDKYITVIEEGDASFEIAAKCFRDLTTEISPIIAMYNKTSGRLIDLAAATQTYSLKKGDTFVLETPKITIPEEIKQDVILKGFIWDGNMVPLSVPLQLNPVPIWQILNIATNGPVTSGEEVRNLINNNTANKWYTSHVASAANPLWVTWNYSSPVTVDSFMIGTANDSNGRDPRLWTISGSNDGVNYTVFYTHDQNLTTTRREVAAFTLPAPVTYKYYKMEITATRTANNGCQMSIFYLLGDFNEHGALY